MSRRHLRRYARATLGAVLLLLGGGLTDLWAAPTLKRSDFYRYHRWVETRAGQPDSVSRSLFSLDEPAAAAGLDLVPDRLGTAARSLVTLEDQLVRNWTDTKAFTAAQCLDAARAYRDVGEHAAALTWYRRSAQARGSASSVPAEVRHEMFASAVQTGDSLQVTVELLNLVGLASLAPVDRTVELAFRWLAVRDDGRNLKLLLDKVDGQLANLGPRNRFWAAYAHALREERDACLAQLLRLLADPAAPGELAPSQSDWALRTIPDLLYLDGRRDDALRLYAALSEGRGDGAAWARYQVANMHLLAGDYGRARPLFAEICDAEAEGGWRARACALAGLTDRLASIREGGETYGLDALHRR